MSVACPGLGVGLGLGVGVGLRLGLGLDRCMSVASSGPMCERRLTLVGAPIVMPGCAAAFPADADGPYESRTVISAAVTTVLARTVLTILWLYSLRRHLRCSLRIAAAYLRTNDIG